MSHDRRVLALALAGGAPAVVLATLFLRAAPWPASVRLAAGVAMIAVWIGVAVFARRQVARPLQTVSNLLAALREGDFSIRARTGGGSDPLEHVMFEINTLADTLRGQRLGAQEATALLHAVMAEIDVAIFAFDGRHRLVLANRYGARLLGATETDLVGRPADALGLQSALETPGTLQDLTFAGGAGRWEMRRTRFFQGGSPHDLLALSDLSQPLREQEREAWRRLIRVIGHELNNSLAPIKSIAGSLESLLGREPLPADWRDDMTHGLGIIASRSDALGRFTSAYARLARLPPPSRVRTELAPLIRRVASLESRRAIALVEGPALVVDADADQLEQLLINVTRNAVDAALETGGAVSAGWTLQEDWVEIRVDDEGPGLPSTGNLFVPFFTTKPGGSGIGLALSRQIAEGHGGTLSLANRTDRRGTRAILRLPLPHQSGAAISA
ncbi:MAG TPA: ATP-binding protein [Vicinamibacterales bacterium]|jgi:nitrogen fixation/metabolism regulation signal transduction histidine kinase|nr:ATP-binding protein [Vicinamibacterales bacterium]